MTECTPIQWPQLHASVRQQRNPFDEPLFVLFFVLDRLLLNVNTAPVRAKEPKPLPLLECELRRGMLRMTHEYFTMLPGLWIASRWEAMQHAAALQQGLP